MGMAGASTVGTCAITAAPAESLLDAWLAQVGGDHGEFCVTQRGELLLARYRGEDAARCRAGFSHLWRTVSAAQWNAAPSEPRIWHT